MPRVALLDPDGDIVRYLSTAGRGRRHPGWACHHTDMWTLDLDGTEVGVVGMAVGAPFAVLVADLRLVLEQGIGTSIDTDDVELPVVVLRRLVQRSPGGLAYE